MPRRSESSARLILVTLAFLVFALPLVVHRSETPWFLGRYSGRIVILFTLGLLLYGSRLILETCWRRANSESRLARFATTELVVICSWLLVGVLIVGVVYGFGISVLSVAASAALFGLGIELSLRLGTVISPEHRRQMTGNLALLLVSVVISIALAELVGRTFSRPRVGSAYAVLPPSVELTFTPSPDTTPGILGLSRFTTNDLGIRGDPYSETNFNILAVGGSTTELLDHDDTEAWPMLLQRRLSAQISSRKVWVGNVGRAGHRSVEHALVIERFVPQLRVDALLVLVGVNDLTQILRKPDSRLPDPRVPEVAQNLLWRTFWVVPRSVVPWWRSSGLWHLSRNLVARAAEEGQYVRRDVGHEWLHARRRAWIEAPRVVREMPNLDKALGQYERNLRTILASALDADVPRVVLVTQPAVWQPDSGIDVKHTLWIGYVGGAERPVARYSTGVLREAMDLFNRRLIRVARDVGVEWVDLSARMDGQSDLFYDDVHFTEAGSREVAKVLSELDWCPQQNVAEPHH